MIVDLITYIIADFWIPSLFQGLGFKSSFITRIWRREVGSDVYQTTEVLQLAALFSQGLQC